jgi:hypothetical protein
MLTASKAFRFVLFFFFFFFLSLSLANAQGTVRGATGHIGAPTIDSRNTSPSESPSLTPSTSPSNSPSSTPEGKVDLQTAGDYAILAKSGISTVPNSIITGNIAVSPIAATAMTGFSLTLAPTGDYSTSTQVKGTSTATAASYGGDVAKALTTAVSDMETAYTDAAGRVNPDAARINLGAGILGGAFGGPTAPLTPGVYTFGSDVLITKEIFFDGTAQDIFIIQISGNLVLDANLRVKLSSGALAKNIIWQVAGNVKVMAGAHMEGILLVKTDVLFMTGSSLNGRVLAQTACNLQMATITQP